MVLFRSLIRAYAEPNFKACEVEGTPDPASVQEALSETIRLTNNYVATIHESSGMFATLFFGIFDPESGLLTYVNCGHEAPIIIGPDGMEETLKPTGPAIGVHKDHTFSIEQVKIESARTLFVYTDGTSDAQNPEGDYFTKPRLMELLEQPYASAEELIQDVTRNLKDHISVAELYDDVTLMAIKHL